MNSAKKVGRTSPCVHQSLVRMSRLFHVTLFTSVLKCFISSVLPSSSNPTLLYANYNFKDLLTHSSSPDHDVSHNAARPGPGSSGTRGAEWLARLCQLWVIRKYCLIIEPVITARLASHISWSYEREERHFLFLCRLALLSHTSPPPRVWPGYERSH